MINPLQEGGLLETLQDTLVQSMFTDTATLYHKLSAEEGGAGASDGRGGYGDSRGGETDTYDSGVIIPCRMDTIPSRLTDTIADGIQSNTSKDVIYIPQGTVATSYDKIKTDAGTPLNSRTQIMYEILYVVRETEQFDLGLIVNRVDF